ncbi:hypothetical protein VNO77_22909 [Canavalia gladiata]|uniref:SAM-dependent methyltransferase RsmB-F/NOP2-type catalytic core domain-containing protein n=1 Tax=Canavalia gladiata TaxID=3824 RepID=A0AAN9QB82_CANGL
MHLVIGVGFLLLMEQLQLFLADFILTFETGEFGLEETGDLFKEWTSRRPWKERKMAKKSGTAQLVSKPHPPELIYYGPHSGVVGLTTRELYMTLSNDEIANHGFNKVLVDEECTHDGSVKHIQKFEQWGWGTFQDRVLDADRTDNLHALQLDLLTVEGSLVYSTCSLTVAQNEDMVEQFLKENEIADTYQKAGARGSMHARSLILKTAHEGAWDTAHMIFLDFNQSKHCEVQD